MRLDLLVDGQRFWPRLLDDLAAARRQVLMQTYTFEGDSAGRAVGEALRDARAADRRLVVDDFTWHRMSDHFLYHPRHLLRRELWEERDATRSLVAALRASGAGVRFTNPVGWLFTRLPLRNHKKLVVVDGRVAYIGGINFSDHNHAWHDLMLRIEDEAVAAFLAVDFESTWRGQHQATAWRFPGLELYVLSGQHNEAQFGVVLDLIAGARERIFVESPYLAPPFSEALVRASQRGAEVTVLSPATNNWRLCREHILWKAARSRIRLRALAGRMTHMKAMLIDDRWLVLGSANFELWSFHFQQEYVAVVDDPETVGQFRAQVVEPDLAAAQTQDNAIAPWRGRWADWRFDLMERGALLLCGAYGRDGARPPSAS